MILPVCCSKILEGKTLANSTTICQIAKIFCRQSFPLYGKAKKGIGSVSDPFGMGTYTASDKCPALNSGLVMLD